MKKQENNLSYFQYKLYFIFQAEDGIRDQPRSRGLGDVYKRQPFEYPKDVNISPDKVKQGLQQTFAFELKRCFIEN